MSNSRMVDYYRASPNYYAGRTRSIDRITPHCVVGQCSVETLGAIFSRPEKDASCNYGVGYDGRIGCYVDEGNTSWCSSSRENDNRAITIEVASDTTYPYAVRPAAWAAMLNLIEDVMRRHGKTRLIWFGNRTQSLTYQPAANEMVLTCHRWFANKSCPGEYIYSREDQIANEINRRLAEDPSSYEDEKEVCNVVLPILRLNDESGYVRTMQILLNKYNSARLTEDGAFGPATHRAVIAYQRDRGLDVDGIVGAQTWAQLLK